MKKKSLTALVCAAVLALGCVLFAACGSDDASAEVTMSAQDGTFYIVKANATKGSLYDGLKECMENKAFDSISFSESTDGGECTILKINSLTAGDGKVWKIYTTLTEHDGTQYTSETAKVTIQDVTYYVATVDCKTLPLVKDAGYYIALE